ncbi:hypothetical protein L1987_30551 [Smallanthus sonchifolius]|uniref:Uncharacterized protein n=1 Tax=Smallanthus sonchifolius TaxID=185202 RepID=A0ACB9I2I1_9ASTR|nr:hypothetical protein L1987_30551 [Smallanthus sonchifolius]
MCADEVVHNEEVVDKQNADDGVNCGNDEQDMQTTGAKIDEKNKKGENEEKHEADDEEEETILFMRTWLMEHGGYKQEDTQKWGLDKLKEEMNKAKIEIAMYENRSLEQTKKSSLNRMGDERLLKELGNLKKLVGAKSVLKEIQEATDPENVDKDVDTLLASVAFLQIGEPKKKEEINQEKRVKTLSNALKSPYVNRKVAMGDKLTTTESLVTNYIFKDTAASRYKKIKIAEIKRAAMTWRTLNNKVDCGIFAVRHMETHTGDPTWQCGFDDEKELEKQIRQVTELRYKYVSKILLSDLNIYKNHLLDLAKEYKKSTEGKKEDTKRNLFEELMER